VEGEEQTLGAACRADHERDTPCFDVSELLVLVSGVYTVEMK